MSNEAANVKIGSEEGAVPTSAEPVVKIEQKPVEDNPSDAQVWINFHFLYQEYGLTFFMMHVFII